MRYIVGYTEDSRGQDALALAAALARTPDAQIDVVCVLGNPAPADAGFPPERAVQELLTGKAEGWLDNALALLPEGIRAEKHIRYAESFAEGLLAAAAELNAGLIVIGAARNGLLKRSSVGSVANALLYSSPVPVALAPHGYEHGAGITRITCGIGDRPGKDLLLEVAVDTASRRRVPLRLVSLLDLGAEHASRSGHDDGGGASANNGALGVAERHADHVLAEATELAAGRAPVTAMVAHGTSVEDAVESVDWVDGEVVLIGSSRLAERRRLFLGSTAGKMLRALPVPMVVVPRGQDRLDP